jgi:hypothetical protein
VEAVVAMDALARVGRFAPSAVLRIQDRHRRTRWRRRVPGVVDLSEPRAESLMETRSRLVLVLRGLPRPELQYQVYDEFGEFVARLDMAYPGLKLAMEYDGRGHLTALAAGGGRPAAQQARRVRLVGPPLHLNRRPPPPRRHGSPDKRSHLPPSGVVNSTPATSADAETSVVSGSRRAQIGSLRKMGRGRWRRADMT